MIDGIPRSRTGSIEPIVRAIADRFNPNPVAVDRRNRTPWPRLAVRRSDETGAWPAFRVAMRPPGSDTRCVRQVFEQTSGGVDQRARQFWGSVTRVSPTLTSTPVWTSRSFFTVTGVLSLDSLRISPVF